jgi:hypothetical protein
MLAAAVLFQPLPMDRPRQIQHQEEMKSLPEIAE